MLRTHTCGELSKKNIKKKTTLCGWVQSPRDHGGLIFLDIRDRYGITQVVFDPNNNKDAHAAAETLRREDVIQISGHVRARPKGMKNAKLITGEIEVLADEINILNKSETPPLEVDERTHLNEDIRLKYRYIDLRRPQMQANIALRSKVMQKAREYLVKNGFLEIETPVLAKSTPEGARDYLVPSRVHPGKFYALPQSPQLFKQLLMLSGFDRYFQIAKCFRDEDLRADRQPEFTQIDIEMSFIEEEDIYAIVEGLVKELFSLINLKVKTPFPRMTYSDAMDKYGSDAPDTRFGLQLADITEIAKRSNFDVFKTAIAHDGCVKCINVKGCAGFSRKDIDELAEFVAQLGAKGLSWMKMQDKLESSIVKFFSPELQKEIINKCFAQNGDLLLIVADHKHFIVNSVLSHLRLHLAKRLNLIPKDAWDFVWVTDFPLLQFDEDQQKHVAVHHPFTSPKKEDIINLEKYPSKVRARAYDIVLNGTEIGGGSIRIHTRELQEKVFKAIGMDIKEAEEKFAFLLDAFRYGAPPHGGIAFGLDRIVALMAGVDSIREVIAFPKNKAAQSLMDDCPNEVDSKQLKELNIKVDIVKKKDEKERAV